MASWWLANLHLMGILCAHIWNECVMAVFVDDERIPWRGRRWCHLVADTLAELHDFADRLGLRRDWFQERASYPHYDITLLLRDRAVQMGARSADKAQLLLCCRKLKLELLSSVKESESPSRKPLQGDLL